MIAAIIISVLAAILICGGLTVSYLIYKMAFRSRPDPEQDQYRIPNNEEYAVFKDKMISSIGELDAIPYESVYITSKDGLKLFGRYYHITDGAPIHIELHGYRSLALRDFCGGNSIVRSLKHNTLLVDQRAHGKSEGRTITYGIKERSDCLCWIEYLIDRFGKDTKIFLSGVSMGAATVLMATELPLPENVVGIIADCPYSSPSEIISKVAKDLKLPAKISMPFVHLGAALFGRFKLSETTAVKAVQKSITPILLIHGESDGFVPFEMSLRIADSCASALTFLPVPEAGHALSYMVNTALYTNACIKFINECLQ